MALVLIDATTTEIHNLPSFGYFLESLRQDWKTNVDLRDITIVTSTIHCKAYAAAYYPNKCGEARCSFSRTPVPKFTLYDERLYNRGPMRVSPAWVYSTKQFATHGFYAPLHCTLMLRLGDYGVMDTNEKIELRGNIFKDNRIVPDVNQNIEKDIDELKIFSSDHVELPRSERQGDM